MLTVCIVRTRTQSVFSLVSRYTHSVLGEMNVTDRNENNKIGTIDCMGVGLWGSSCILCIWQELPEE